MCRSRCWPPNCCATFRTFSDLSVHNLVPQQLRWTCTWQTDHCETAYTSAAGTLLLVSAPCVWPLHARYVRRLQRRYTPSPALEPPPDEGLAVEPPVAAGGRQWREQSLQVGCQSFAAATGGP